MSLEWCHSFHMTRALLVLHRKSCMNNEIAVTLLVVSCMCVRV